MSNTLILNSNGFPLSLLPISAVNWHLSVKLLVLDKFRVLEEYEDLHENKRGPEKNIRLANKEFILTQVKTSPESKGERYYRFVE